MEKIVQLRENEYSDLFNKARLNENEIKELAEKTIRREECFGLI